MLLNGLLQNTIEDTIARRLRCLRPTGRGGGVNPSVLDRNGVTLQGWTLTCSAVVTSPWGNNAQSFGEEKLTFSHLGGIALLYPSIRIEFSSRIPRCSVIFTISSSSSSPPSRPPSAFPRHTPTPIGSSAIGHTSIDRLSKKGPESTIILIHRRFLCLVYLISVSLGHAIFSERIFWVYFSASCTTTHHRHLIIPQRDHNNTLLWHQPLHVRCGVP
ncbi:uncharacterized protein BO66DRAFT_216920 [Aspergillus aculeatinus CBS 121060]|uniref:Uncharacterized protein n=1 Tax=Aspergillus aculeatinus CBS 121060 TaxID=1448322 RepID=A0ACD1GV50_9EURO|nr:hypothetical protein BO66DRAFT_216920 [Aspergillus aculeatinus CBS 121060]RAH65195.1 hypothetical protein BO66DRAFT_216920 [Aspergillus aculeatinus CBS 121060]